jgi:hypothetical protein
MVFPEVCWTCKDLVTTSVQLLLPKTRRTEHLVFTMPLIAAVALCLCSLACTTLKM